LGEGEIRERLGCVSPCIGVRDRRRRQSARRRQPADL
jgi:hypothetical protein